METVRFAFRDEKINIYAMTYGNLTGPYSHQIFLCKKEPFSKKYNGPFLLIPKKTTNKYNPSIKGLDYINKIENLRYDYSFIAYIDSYIKIHISEDIFKTLCNTGFFDIWDPKEPIDYFSERHEGYLAIFRVFKTNQIHDDIEFKGRNFYFELNEPFSTQLGQPVINDDQFQETKSTLIDVLNSNNSLIEYLEPGKKEIFQIRLEEILD